MIDSRFDAVYILVFTPLWSALNHFHPYASSFLIQIPASNEARRTKPKTLTNIPSLVIQTKQQNLHLGSGIQIPPKQAPLRNHRNLQPRSRSRYLGNHHPSCRKRSNRDANKHRQESPRDSALHAEARPWTWTRGWERGIVGHRYREDWGVGGSADVVCYA